jgi:hypothetical protein
MSKVNIHDLAKNDKNYEALRTEITKSPGRINEKDSVSDCLDFVLMLFFSITTFFCEIKLKENYKIKNAVLYRRGKFIFILFPSI